MPALCTPETLVIRLNLLLITGSFILRPEPLSVSPSSKQVYVCAVVFIKPPHETVWSRAGLWDSGEVEVDKCCYCSVCKKKTNPETNEKSSREDVRVNSN